MPYKKNMYGERDPATAGEACAARWRFCAGIAR
jgi:hypothetical protein